MFERLIKFLKEDVWRIPTDEKPLLQAVGIKSLRVILLISQGFRKSQIQQGASSLTYYSLLSLGPLIVILLGIARAFLVEDALKTTLIERYQSQKTFILQLFKYEETSMRQANAGIFAFIGLLVLFWAAMKILIYMEQFLNEIWDVQKERSYARKFSDYLAIGFISPILILLSSTVTVYLSTRLSSIAENGLFFKEIGLFVASLLNLLPYLLTGALFTFLYIFIPNTSVRFKPAFFAGLFAGAASQIIQWIYLRFQIGVSTYNAIYGTFAALPLFLIYLHLTWIVFLLGAKVAFALQNVEGYEFLIEDFQLSRRFHDLLSLKIIHLLVQKFKQKEPSITPLEVSNILSIPLILTNKLLLELEKTHLLVEIERKKDRERAFLLSCDPDQLTIKRVLDMIDTVGESIPLAASHESQILLNSLKEFDQHLEGLNANLLLKEI